MGYRRGLSIALFALLCASVRASPVPSDTLSPASSLTVRAAGGDDRTFDIRVPQGFVIDLSVSERQGMAGVIVAAAADGTPLAFADLDRRQPVARRVLLPPGTAQLVVRAPNHSPLERVFDLRTGPLVPIADTERRLAAERLLGDGERRYRQKDPDYLTASLEAYERALAEWTRAGDGPRQIDALLHLSYGRYEHGDMAVALETYRRALDLATAIDDRAQLAAALQGLALVSADTGDNKSADAWATRALDLRRTLGDLRGQIETLFVIGALRFSNGRNDEARAIYLDTAALAQQAGDRVRQADSLNFLGVLEASLAHRPEAADLYTKALAIDRDEHEPIRAAQRLSNLGSLHLNAGEIREAIAALEQALPIRRSLASPNAYGNTLYNLGLCHVELGEYNQALAAYKEALTLFERTTYRRGQGFVLRALGDLYLATGDATKAQRFLERAAAAWRSIPDPRGEVLALNSLGTLASRRHETAQAMALHRQALAMARTGGYQREEAQALGLLATLARERGDLAAALEAASRALELARQTGDKIGEADALFQQGAIQRRLGHPDAARDALEQSLMLSEQAETRLAQANTLDEIVRLERDRGHLAEAAERSGKAIALLEAIGATASDREARMRFAAAHRRTYDLAMDVAMARGRVEEAFALSERARARGLVEMMREARLQIRSGVDPALLARERNVQELLDAKHERLTRLLAGPHSATREAAERQAVDRLVDDYRAIEADIRATSPHYAALMTPPALSVADVQRRLPDTRTALLELWLGEDRSYAWIVTKRTSRGFVLPPAQAVRPVALRAYRALNARNARTDEDADARQRRIQAADVQFAHAAAELSRLLLRPLRASLASARRLWIVSDGELQYLPFAALPWPGTTEPLIVTREVVGLPSAAVMAVVRDELAGRPRPARGVAVFADPVFRADDERVVREQTAPAASDTQGRRPTQTATDTNRGGAEDDPEEDADIERAAIESGISTLPRLHFSRQEADAIVARAPAATTRVALDFEASRAEAKNPDLAQYRVLHFATHGLLDNRHPELSGIVLSLVDRHGRMQDGFLRLHEIYNLQLNADLVVLSACQTALGEDVRSEGLIGLVRGFMYAGSPQVLASLWSVRDRATAELMRRFYDGLLARRLAPEAALRAAQLSMLHDAPWRQPYYWASFTLQGTR